MVFNDYILSLYHILSFCSNCLWKIAKRIRGESPESASSRSSEIPTVILFFFTALLWGSALIIALCTRNLKFILAFSGSLTASIIGYILPALLFFRSKSTYQLSNEFSRAVRSDEDMSTFQRGSYICSFLAPVLLFVFGLITLIAGTVTSFEML